MPRNSPYILKETKDVSESLIGNLGNLFSIDQSKPLAEQERPIRSALMNLSKGATGKNPGWLTATVNSFISESKANPNSPISRVMKGAKNFHSDVMEPLDYYDGDVSPNNNVQRYIQRGSHSMFDGRSVAPLLNPDVLREGFSEQPHMRKLLDEKANLSSKTEGDPSKLLADSEKFIKQNVGLDDHLTATSWGNGSWTSIKENAPTEANSIPMYISPDKRHGFQINQKAYFALQDPRQIPLHVNQIDKVIRETMGVGPNQSSGVQFKFNQDIVNDLTTQFAGDHLVVHATTEKSQSALGNIVTNLSKYFEEQNVGISNVDKGFDVTAYDPANQNVKFAESYTNILKTTVDKEQKGNANLHKPMLSKIFGHDFEKAMNIYDHIDESSVLGQDLQRLGLLEKPAISDSSEAIAAQRKDRLPHSDAAIEHLAERKETEKWQKQVLLELEGKSEPELTLSQTTEYYEKNTSEKQKKKDRELFLDEKRREANLAPEELMLERAETTRRYKEDKAAIRGSKRYEEIIDRWRTKRQSDVPTHSQTKAAPPKSTSKVVEPKLEKVKEEVSKKVNKKSTASAVEESIRLENKKKTKSKKKSGGRNKRKTTDAAKYIQENKNKKKVSKIKHGLDEDKKPKDAGRLDNSYDKKKSSREQTLSVDDANTLSIREASKRLRGLEEQKKQEKQDRAEKRSKVGKRDILPQTNSSPERVAQPKTRTGTTNSDISRFYLDIEATGLAADDRDRIISAKTGAKAGVRKRGVMPQLIQFYGVFDDEVNVAGKDINRHGFLDLGPTSTNPNKNPDSIYNKLQIEFLPEGRSDYLTEDQIGKTMADGQDQILIEKLQKREGDFRLATVKTGEDVRLTPGNAQALEELIVTNKHNPTPGMMPISTAQVGSTMSKILASNVFEAKFGRPNMRTTQEIVGETLTKLQDRVDRGHEVELRGWNIGYDVERYMENIERYGTSPQKAQAKKLFGERINDNASSIKVIDEADKLKDIEFMLMVRDKKYSAAHLNKVQINQALDGKGKEVHRKVTKDIQQNIENNRTGKYIKKVGGVKNFANLIGQQLDSPKTMEELSEHLTGKLLSTQGRVGAVTSLEKQSVDTITETIFQMSENMRSNPQQGVSATEHVRKMVNTLSGQERGRVTLDRITNGGQKQGSLFGIRNDSGITLTENGLERSALEFRRMQATGLDMMSGYTLGSGQGGLIGSLVSVKETYGETIQSDQLKRIFDVVGTSGDSAASGTLAGSMGKGLHDASVDVKSMMKVVIDLFDEGMNNSSSMDGATQEYFQKVMDRQIMNAAEGHIERHISSAEIEDNILHKAGVTFDGRMPGEAQLDVADTGKNIGTTVGEAAKAFIDPVQRGAKTKAGVLVKASLIGSGLVLLGNMNGDIKQPGSKHNTLEGVSPSGDTLLHSFGSGSDSYSNQAINDLKYRFNLGSQTLRSSMLGYRGDQLYNNLLGFNTFNDYTRSSERGNIAHSIIEQEYMSKGLAQAREHFVHSAELDVVGHIDLVLNSGVPLEIKSVEDFEALQKLKAPKEHHISQANFYAYALEQPYALIGYAARNDPTKVKYFKIDTNLKRLTEDVQRVRSTAENLRREGHEVVTYSAHKYMSDLYLKTTQNKYSAAAAGTAVSVGEGMLQSPENYGGYSAIPGLGDYSKHQKKKVWRQEKRANLTSPTQYKGKSKIRNQAKHADLHGNAALKYKGRDSAYHNRSRQLNYSGV